VRVVRVGLCTLLAGLVYAVYWDSPRHHRHLRSRSRQCANIALLSGLHEGTLEQTSGKAKTRAFKQSLGEELCRSSRLDVSGHVSYGPPPPDHDPWARLCCRERGAVVRARESGGGELGFTVETGTFENA
jgi:hypothetical protein